MRPNFNHHTNQALDQFEKNSEFKLKVQTSNHSLLYKGTHIAFTKREFIALKNIAIGFTAKEIANQMQISPRTAEEHINNIKQKLGVQHKSRILSALLALDIDITKLEQQY